MKIIRIPLFAALIAIVLTGTLIAAERPNIIVILADDLGAETLGCYGGTSYPTPNLDKLALTGARFENCFATPLCSPSRAELLTGRYSFRTGMTNVILPDQPEKRLDWQKHRTFAHFLGDAGYATAIAGKWHVCHDFLSNPTHVADAGFSDRYMWRLFKDDKVSRHYWNPSLWLEGKEDETTGKGKFGDDLFTSHLLEFIRASQNRPFLVYYPMTLVHSQTATGKNWPRSPATLKPGDDPDADGGPNGFGDLVAYMDTQVGKITEELDTLKLRENTLLIFTGDNGTNAKITSLFKGERLKGGKGSVTEAGTRVPLIVSWPGTLPPGRVLNDLVDFTDFLPTLLEAAGVNLPSDYQVDGQSFMPQLRGQQGQPREWVYRQLGGRWFIRDQQYRLDNQGGFVDLTDRYHPKPAADSIEAAEARKRLQAAVEKLRPAAAR
jgi:arylsulfatase A